MCGFSGISPRLPGYSSPEQLSENLRAAESLVFV